MHWFSFTDTDGEEVALNVARCTVVNFVVGKHADIYDMSSSGSPWRITKEDDITRLRRMLFPLH